MNTGINVLNVPVSTRLTTLQTGELNRVTKKVNKTRSELLRELISDYLNETKKHTQSFIKH